MTIYTFAEGIPCPHCGNAERTILVADGHPDEDRPVAGACEACSVDLYWAWKKLLADAAPRAGSPADRVSRVKVMIARRKTSSSGVPEPAEISTSYEVFMVSMPDGTLDLPTADVGPGEPEVDAARRALSQAGIATWPTFLDSLYTAHVPRGSLCRVYLARVYAMPGDTPETRSSPWRDWPLGKHVPAMAGFYLALRDVWPLVLRAPRSLAVGSQTLGSQTLSEICVGLRRGALEYIKMQQQIREKIPNVDTSMAEYLRRGMTDDEKLVEKALRKEEDLSVLAQASSTSDLVSAGGKVLSGERVVLDAEEISDSEDPEFDPTSDSDASSTTREAMLDREDDDVL